MAQPQVLYFGGNGHATGRLSAARAALDGLAVRGTMAPFVLSEAPYPGFEGRPRARDLDAFLDALVPLRPPALVQGTGIGGLLALVLRSRGQLLDTPLVLHAPVLWGLEKRWMPRLLRLLPARLILRPLFAARWYQRRFVKKQFVRPLDVELREAFFAGYAACEAAPDFFAWLTPALLRVLEARFAQHPERLANITMWWGDRDNVVTLRELELTQQALAITFPLKRFAEWGHYPMIEHPEQWITATAEALDDRHQAAAGEAQERP